MGKANRKATRYERGHTIKKFAWKHAVLPLQIKYILKETIDNDMMEDVARAIIVDLNNK